MTTKRFYLLNYNNYPIYDSLLDEEYNAQFKAQREKLCLLLNELHEENQSIKKHIGELYKFVKIDVDNEIEVYPKALLEYIVNILKIIGDVE